MDIDRNISMFIELNRSLRYVVKALINAAKYLTENCCRSKVCISAENTSMAVNHLDSNGFFVPLWPGVGEYNTRKGNNPAVHRRFSTPGLQLTLGKIENNLWEL